MVCNNCGEEMTMITDNGRTGYVCLHCGNSFVPSQDDKTSKPEKRNITAGATALISVLAVPVTILAGLLISNRRKS